MKTDRSHSQVATTVVISDDATQIRVLTELLRTEGLQVQAFGSAGAALSALDQDHPPDLVITSDFTSGVDWWRFCRLPRSSKDEPLKRIPVLMISASFSGPDAVLPAPVDPKRFATTVRLLLRGEQLLDSEHLIELCAGARRDRALLRVGNLLGKDIRGLRQTKDMQSKAMDSLHDAVHVVDRNLRFVLINERFRQWREELALARNSVGGGLQEALPFLPEATIDEYRRVLESGRPLTAREHLKIDGRSIVTETSKTPLMENGEVQGVLTIVSDITDRERAQKLLEAERDLGAALSMTSSLDRTLSICLEAALDISGMDCGGVYLVDEETGDLDLAAHRGLSAGFVESVSHYDAGSPSARLIQEGAPIYTRHTEMGVEIDDTRREAGLRATALLPVLHESRVVGCMNVSSHALEQTPPFARVFLESMMGLIGGAIARAKTEQALRELRERYRNLVKNLPVGLYRSTPGPEGSFTMANPAMVRILGCDSVEKLLQSPVADCFHSTTDYEDLAALLLSRGKVVAEQLRLRKCDGTPIWSTVTAGVVRNESGQIAGFDGLVEEITERKRQEGVQAALLRLFEYAGGHTVPELLRKFLDEGEALTGSEIGFYHFVEEDQVTLSLQAWSTSGQRICTAPDAGASWPVSEAGVWVDCVREGRPVIHNDCSNLPRKKGLSEGHAPVIRELAVPVIRRGKPVAILGVGNKQSDYDEDDVKLLGQMADVAWETVFRKRVEEKQARLTSAVEQAAEIVVITDTEATIQYVNPAFERITGYGSAEAIGQNPDILLRSGKHDETFYKEMWDTLAQGEIWSGRLINKRKDGGLYTEDGTVSPVRDASGRTTNYVAVKRDITREAELERQLMQAQKMESVGRLAGGVAHDFNNTLGVILGHAELALDQLDSSAPLSLHLGEILKAAERSAHLTRQLLAFARKQTIAPRVLQLNEAVAGMLSMLRRLIGEDVQLTWTPGARLWPVRIDPGQVDQILANLCVNSRDAIAGAGKISIETGNVSLDEAWCATHHGSVPGEYVRLTVSDDGCGMEREILDHVFEPFYTAKEMGRGTGLGLATVYGIVKQNEGFIGAYSEVDHGTAIRIYLPRFGRGEDREKEAAGTVEALEGNGETVLLVEDDEAVLRTSRAMLERLEYRVLPAAGVEDAIRQAEDHEGEIDLLITDVIMPGMDGRELAGRLEKIRPGMKCLFMSGYTTEIIGDRGVLEEGVLFIQKPFTRRDLAVTIREALLGQETAP